MAGLVADFTAIVGSPMDDDMTAVAVTRLARPAAPPASGSAPAPPAAPPPARLVASADLSAIPEALAAPLGGFLEITAAGLADVGPACYAPVARGGLCLSLNVASVAACGAVRLVTDALRVRYGGARDWTAVEIILGEAVANAVLHGSLGVSSGLRESRDGLDRFAQLIQAGLDDPERGGRRVEVTVVPDAAGGLEIAVHDRGRGFDVAAASQDGPTPGGTHGRGLALIRRLARSTTFRDGGRTLVFTV